MTRIDSIALAWISHGWLLLLAFTLALLVVALLRKPCRRLFGAERAFQLWLLPPLAMIASQLPHAASATTSTFSIVVSTITTMAGVIPAHVDQSHTIDWRTGVVLIWLAGIVIALGMAMRAQSQYRIRMLGATRVDDLPSRWPVLRAISTDIGPALVGAWRVRIVLPSDFDERYDVTERSLILVHEAMHARRRDGWWCLLAQVIVAVFWFHPLAWFAFSALRQDQELACDAAVLCEHGTQRRAYANAMLKTQSAAFSLPVGCPWFSDHPITERIAMLKLNSPSLGRRLIGTACVFAFITGFTTVVYAVNQPQAASKSSVSSPQIFQLAMSLSQGEKTLAAPTLCVRANEHASISTSDADGNGKLGWTFDLMLKPLASDVVELDVKGFIRAPHEHTTDFNPVLRGPFNRSMVVKVADQEGAAPMILTMTPTEGCGASEAAKSK